MTAAEILGASVVVAFQRRSWSTVRVLAHELLSLPRPTAADGCNYSGSAEKRNEVGAEEHNRGPEAYRVGPRCQGVLVPELRDISRVL